MERTIKYFERVLQKYGNLYDYSKSVYVNAKTPILIVCKKHGDFFQRPDSHLLGGCNKCAKEQAGSTRNLKYKASFIDKIKIIHGDIYDYSSTEYSKARNKITVICKIHGPWEIQAYSHLNGNGCPKCGDIKIGKKLVSNISVFLRRAKKLHGEKYDYSNVVYENARLLVDIICPDHGIFKQTPDCHLNRGYGCPRCNDRWKSQNEWLNYCNVPNDTKHRQVRITLDNGKHIVADGFVPETNTIYEFWGTYYHGHPEFHKIDEFSFMGKTFGNLYESTLKKIDEIKKSGYQLIDIWEHDWKKND